MYILSKVAYIILMMAAVIVSGLSLNKNRFGWFISGMLLGFFFAYVVAGWLNF